MALSAPFEFDDWLNLLDMDAIADPNDKIVECEYFLEFASAEPNVQRFRWLISAFFGAAYSFFEISGTECLSRLHRPKNRCLYRRHRGFEYITRLRHDLSERQESILRQDERTPRRNKTTVRTPQR